MSFRVRAARESDLRAFYNLSKLTGGGFTNLPAEKATLEGKLKRSSKGFARKGDTPGDDLYIFMLEKVPASRSSAPARCLAPSVPNIPSTAT